MAPVPPSPDAASDSPDAVLSVSELTHHIRALMGEAFGDVWVRGEVSRVVYHGSGHVYLTLKDQDAVVDAVIWRSTVGRLRFRIEQGEEVLVRGGIDVYPPRGHYQLIIRHVEPLGEGALRRAFEQMRRRLEAEGLFDPAEKKTLPFLPRRVALITSPTGAALRDLVTVMRRRLPAVELVLLPARVQGEGAAEEIARAIRLADEKAGADVIVVGRGGGSLEDLWAFNEEIVARAIHAAKTPVVSAVGHETDVTISDLVADVRAATPSQAGELVVPLQEDLEQRLDATALRLRRALRGQVDMLWQQLEALAERPLLREPGRLLRHPRQRLDLLRARLDALSPRARLARKQERLRDLGARLAPPLERRLGAARERVGALTPRLIEEARRGLERRRTRLTSLDDRLRALSPLAVLGRGYALVSREDGTVVRHGDDVAAGDMIRTRIADGSEIDARVDTVRPPEETTG